MKHIGKLLTTAGILVAAGVLFLGISVYWLLHTEQKESHQTDMEYEEHICTVAEEVTAIKVRLDAEQVEIRPSEGDEMSVTYYEKADDEEYRITSGNGMLRIERKQTPFALWVLPDMTRMFGIQEKNAHPVILYVPENYQGSYDLGISSGSITMQDVWIRDELRIEGTSGNVTCKNIICDKDVSTDLTSGTLQINDMTVKGDCRFGLTSGNSFINEAAMEGDLEMTMTSGDSSIQDLDVAGTFRYDITSGTCNVDQLAVNRMEIEMTSGKADLNDCAIHEGVDVNMTPGNLTLRLKDSENDYSVLTEVTSGSCNLSDRIGGDKYINLDMTSGTADVFFAE